MSILSGDGAGWRPDNRREWAFVLTVLGVAALSVGVGTLQYVQAHPGAPWQVEAAASSMLAVTGQSTLDANTTLRVSVEDAQYLNRIYRELDGYTETGYCLAVLGDELRVSKAATLEATASTLRYSTANCQFVDGTIHTHPPGSRPMLSGPDTAVREDWNDRQSLLNAPYQLSCVQAGLMTTTPGEETQAFRCYTEPASGEIDDEFPEIPVVIVE